MLGVVHFELLSDLLPVTTENFVKLCESSYKGTRIHAIMADVGICGGDHIAHDGTGGCSALGDIFFKDEAFLMRHGRGIITMLNGGVDTNNSQFCITTRRSPQLDGRKCCIWVRCRRLRCDRKTAGCVHIATSALRRCNYFRLWHREK